jgi:AcrR family transcriptional regulator
MEHCSESEAAVGSSERRERERLKLRGKILDAARKLFIQEGYEAVTMRKIAKRIEYSATAIYAHFADKEALMRELCSEDFQMLATGFQEVAAIEDPIERLRQTGRAYVDFAVRYPNHYRLIFMTPRPAEFEADQEGKGDVQKDAYAFLVAVVEDAMAKGAFKKDWKDADLLAQVLWAGMHGVVALHLVGGEDKWVDWRPLDATAQAMSEALYQGVLRQEQSNG